MGSRECYEGLSQGNRQHHVPMAQQGHHSQNHRRCAMVASPVVEVVVVDMLSMQCFQCVQGMERHPSL